MVQGTATEASLFLTLFCWPMWIFGTLMFVLGVIGIRCTEGSKDGIFDRRPRRFGTRSL